MEAGTDHYLEVIKPLSSMSTTEQLLCQLARTVYETDCQLVAVEPPNPRPGRHPFTQFGMATRENEAIDLMVSG